MGNFNKGKLPAIEMNRLSTIESNIIKVHQKIRKEQRARELLNWARDDYGIDMIS